MDMDSHTHGDMTNTQPVNVSELVPVPHEVHHMHGVPILETELTPAERLFWEAYNTTSYFTIDTPHKTNLYIHLALIYLAYVVMYPLALAVKDTKMFFPALVVQSGVVLVSIANYSIFITTAPDLYPNNAYTKMTSGLAIMVLIHVASAFVYTAKKWLEGPSNTNHMPLPGKDIPLSPMDGYASPSNTLYDPEDHMQRLSDDSFDLESTPGTPHAMEFASAEPQRYNRLLSKIFSYRIVAELVSVFGVVCTFNYHFLNWGMLCYFLIYAPTGVAVLSCIGMNEHVFNLLAHFIKGGVFFSMGIVSLARYCGGWPKMGWAWNKSYISPMEKPTSFLYKIQPKKGMVTMEMLESSLILFYGCTNIFMEHLASPGGEWTAKDLQHVSIAFLYLGAGLCGVIAENKMADWRLEKFNTEFGADFEVDGYRPAHVTPGFSPNPFPAFTIFWTGLLMSQHQQASELSTQVHVQWGSLLTYGSLVRLATFALMMFYPQKSFNPTKPFTELITSFCLLCGGLVFMESTDPVITALEYRGMTPMFTLNVSVGVVALVMAWIMVVFSVRDRYRY
ncbi:hypothetical protein OGAPHI_005348 [Ogataea philodendri]|uniref:Uncharacterized protein n=1 Tax=Ogataea philodendri TaxID=1378263 RepID=A0A9P8P0L2_9ASCO|nr:uncharacterized protein OGAPHI_005348 [Ogataea philodendri]KAH3663358.1 hypothetical protein OGAPHI_005348 [Ogataea philodendri]